MNEINCPNEEISLVGNVNTAYIVVVETPKFSLSKDKPTLNILAI